MNSSTKNQVLSEEYCLHCCRHKKRINGCEECGSEAIGIEEENHPLFLPRNTLLDNRYIVGRCIGHGGFGVTYLGIERTLGLRVAIKEYLPRNIAFRDTSSMTVRPFEKSEQYFHLGLEKFLEEAKLLAHFSGHPNIISVIGFFRDTERNTGYLIMPYLEGQTFAKIQQEKGGSIPEDQVIRLCISVLTGLDAIHQAGIIHRDIKPENLYLTNDGQIKILDFGTARFAVDGLQKRLTMEGTPLFSPPEQLDPNFGHQGAWTDLYALGVTLYILLTGKEPIDPMWRMKGVLLPTPRDICGSLVSSYVSDAVMKAIQLNITERFHSASEFINALLDTQQLYPKEEKTWVRTEKSSSENISPSHTEPPLSIQQHLHENIQQSSPDLFSNDSNQGSQKTYIIEQIMTLPIVKLAVIFGFIFGLVGHTFLYFIDNAQIISLAFWTFWGSIWWLSIGVIFSLKKILPNFKNYNLWDIKTLFSSISILFVCLLFSAYTGFFTGILGSIGSIFIGIFYDSVFGKIIHWLYWPIFWSLVYVTCSKIFIRYLNGKESTQNLIDKKENDENKIKLPITEMVIYFNSNKHVSSVFDDTSKYHYVFYVRIQRSFVLCTPVLLEKIITSSNDRDNSSIPIIHAHMPKVVDAENIHNLKDIEHIPSIIYRNKKCVAFAVSEKEYTQIKEKLKDEFDFFFGGFIDD